MKADSEEVTVRDYWDYLNKIFLKETQDENNMAHR